MITWDISSPRLDVFWFCCEETDVAKRQFVSLENCDARFTC